MNEQGKKWRKRSRDSDAAEEVLKRSKHEPVDKPSVKGLDQNSIFGGVTEEQMLMLESVKGHIKELKQVSDSTLDSHRQHSEEPISKSEARRLKKKQKQTEELSKSSSDGGSSKETSTPSCRETALEYLRVWDQERERWSFKKKTQFWLLHNMYKKAMLPKSQFRVMLRYLEGLQGHQRQVVVERAQQILDQYSEEQSEGLPTKREYKRAVAILRVLA